MAEETKTLPHIGPPPTKQEVEASKPQPAKYEPGPERQDSNAALVGFFELAPKLSNKTSDKLDKIWEFASKEAGNEDNADVLMAIRNIESKLAAPRLGQSRVDVLYEYARAELAVRQAEKERNELLR